MTQDNDRWTRNIRPWAIAAFAIVESSTAFKKEPMALIMQYLQ
jgi:hypothetical protein